jgi:hypothetical protein
MPDDPTAPYWPPAPTPSSLTWGRVPNAPPGLQVFRAGPDIVMEQGLATPGNFIVTFDRGKSTYTTVRLFEFINITAIELRCVYAEYLSGNLKPGQLP